MILDTLCFSRYSDISTLISELSVPNIASARAFESSVLPTPVGPKKRNEPIQLDNNELHQVAKMMESFPVLSYKIDYIKFYTPVKNEVKCTIVMQKGESGTPIATSSWYFKLMNYLGGWRLCMMN